MIKKHFINILKNTSPSNAFVYRLPEEDFNNGSTLIVNPGEEAIFIKNGIYIQTFTEGSYKLTTENYPILTRIKTWFSGGVSAFNCCVYFIRKTVTKEYLWGTTTPINVRDKVHNIVSEVKARGAYKIKVSDGLKLLTKVVGTSNEGLYEEEFDNYFENEFQGIIVACISQYLNALNQEMIGIQSQIPFIQRDITPYIQDSISKYGFSCSSFVISGLDVDLTKYNQLDNSTINDITKQTNIAIGKAQAKRVMGDDWGQITSAEILMKLAENPNAGGIAAAGAGMSLGMHAMGTFDHLAKSIVEPIHVTPKEEIQPKKKTKLSIADEQEDEFETKIKQLKIMLKHGAISQQEYDAKIKEILSRI